MIVVLELELVPDRVVAIAGVLVEGDVPRYCADVTSIEGRLLVVRSDRVGD